MDVEDGELYIKHLAMFVRTHERALANSLQRPSTAPATQHIRNDSNASDAAPYSASLSSSSSTASLFSLASLGIGSKPIKAAKLFLTPNQLYYLLSRFEELAVNVGSMSVRLEDILVEPSSSNYVSFVTHAPKSTRRSSDQESIRSISSVRSVMSSMSSMWSKFSLVDRSAAKAEKHRVAVLEDLRYLYSAFTKIPALKLATDHRIRRIAGFEEFPFDTAVPLFVFKNVTALEIIDIDFRSIYGWDRMADQLRSLTIKRAHFDDPADLLTYIVLDDMDGRRWRSSKNSSSPIAASTSSPRHKPAELARSGSASDAPSTHLRRRSADLDAQLGIKVPRRHTAHAASPGRPSPIRKDSLQPHKPKTRARRGSQSSDSTGANSTPHTSSSNLILHAPLPYTKWRFLRHLGLSDNGLTHLSIESLAPIAPTLQSLDLSCNLFTDIPESLATLSSLRSLSLSNCMIETLRSLIRSPLPAITVLSLRGNRLRDLVGAERLLSLERLDIRENNLKDPTELARLSNIPGIRDVFIRRNPFVKLFPNNRVMIFNLFRASPGRDADLTLDGEAPSSRELKELIDKEPEIAQIPVMTTTDTSIGSTTGCMAPPLVPLKNRSVNSGSNSSDLKPQKPRRRRIVQLEPGVDYIASPDEPGNASIASRQSEDDMKGPDVAEVERGDHLEHGAPLIQESARQNMYASQSLRIVGMNVTAV